MPSDRTHKHPKAYRRLRTELARAKARIAELEMRPPDRTESEEFARILHRAPVPVWIAHDPHCHRITGNRAASELAGLGPDTNVSQTPPPGEKVPHVRHRRDGRDLPVEELPLQYAVAHGTELRNAELDLILPDGTVKSILGNVAPLFDAEGHCCGGIYTCIDLTPFKRAEEKLRDSEQQFRALVEVTSDWVWAVDEDGYYTYCSPKIRDLLGYEPEEIVGRQPFDLMPPGEAARVKALFQDMIASRRPLVDIENTNVHKDGHLVVLETSGVPVFDAAGRFLGYRGIDRDITRRRQAEEQLLSLNATLEQRVAERTALAERRAAQMQDLALQLIKAEEKERQRIASILHDHFQQTLVAARLRVILMRRQPERPAGEPLQQIEEILSEAINECRSLTVELCPPILYEAGLAQALQWLAHWMQDRHGLQVNVADDLPTAPVKQELQVILFQAVRELLFNVLKHAGVTVARLEMSVRDQQLRIVVADEGTGFDLPSLLHQQAGMTGYGLFNVRERLELLGGHLEIETGPGRGTHISLIVPAS